MENDYLVSIGNETSCTFETLTPPGTCLSHVVQITSECFSDNPPNDVPPPLVKRDILPRDLPCILCHSKAEQGETAQVTAARITAVWVIGRRDREQCQRGACANGAGIISKVCSRFSTYTLILSKNKKAQHEGFSRVLLPKLYNDILKDGELW